MLQKANDGGVKCCEKAGNWKIRTRKWDDITRRCLAVEQCGSPHALVWDCPDLKEIDRLMAFKALNYVNLTPVSSSFPPVNTVVRVFYYYLKLNQ